MQDVAERSRQKSEILQGYGDAVLRAETLEEQLVKSRKHAAAMQSKLDTAFPSTTMTSKRCMRRATIWCGRTSLSATRTKVHHCLVEYLLEVP
jgi:hypothetical protein